MGRDCAQWSTSIAAKEIFRLKIALAFAFLIGVSNNDVPALTIAQVVILVFIVGIRTIINYSLNRELEE